MPNPYHDPKTGRFTFSKNAVAAGAAKLAAQLAYQQGRRTRDPGEGRVFSSKYGGMQYAPGNEKVVKAARELPDESWNSLPVVQIPTSTKLAANEETLKIAPIEKVTSGREPFREGYITKLYRDSKGQLHVVDGHHRVAMYHALDKPMPARVMTRQDLAKLGRQQKAGWPSRRKK